jgi:hypothetical protein
MGKESTWCAMETVAEPADGELVQPLHCDQQRYLSEAELLALRADMVQLARTAVNSLAGEPNAADLRTKLNTCADLLAAPVLQMRVWSLVEEVGKTYDDVFVACEPDFIQRHSALACQLYNFLAMATNFQSAKTLYRTDLGLADVVLLAQTNC